MKMIKPTEKQVNVIKQLANDDWVMMILHGGVRAGKTFINNIVFLYELERVKKLAAQQGIKQPMYILAAATVRSIENNVITPLGEMFGIYPTRDRLGNYMIRGVKVVPAMHGSIAGLKSVRGFTAYGAYVNEASLANPEVFSEVLKRVSGIDSARVMVDTNPDVPTHWLKTDYIDKAMNSNSDRYSLEEHQRSRILQFKFILDDNTSLSERTRNNIKAVTPSGMLYDRAIFGKWVAGEGAVYVDFKPEQYIESDQLPDITNYYVGVDWGYEHLGVILLLGDDSSGNTYIIKEWTGQHRSIDYWVSIAEQIKAEYGNIPFWCDSARPDNVGAFLNAGINAINANKSIMAGVEWCATKVKRGKVLVNEKACPVFIYELGAYVWDVKKGVPMDIDDHVMDAWRYADYNQHIQGNELKTFEGIF